MTKETLCYLGFSLFPGIGPMHFAQLMNTFRTADKAYSAPEKELNQLLSAKLTQSFLSFRLRTNLIEEEEKLISKKIGYIPLMDNNYPTMLKNISDPPIGLFYRGNWKSVPWNNGIFAGVVGTRKPSFYGQSITSRIVRALAEQKVVVVSGMALGIDTCAHQASLRSSGITVAVLGCGVDIRYPRENSELYDEIIQKGVVLSEFPPGHTVLKGLFVARNRIISGLSKVVVVIEGSSHSGALITARYAAEQGREICAVPGQADTEQAEAPLILLKNGAKLVTSAADILEELKFPNTSIEVSERTPKDVLQKKIVLLLKQEARSTNDLVNTLELEPQKIGKELSFLELEAYIIQDETGLWHLKN